MALRNRRAGPTDERDHVAHGEGSAKDGWARVGGAGTSPGGTPYPSPYGSPYSGSPVGNDAVRNLRDLDLDQRNSRVPGYRGRLSDPEDSQRKPEEKPKVQICCNRPLSLPFPDGHLSSCAHT